MRFSVGYSLLDRDQFNTAIDAFHDSIAEVYFSWPGTASGRSDYRADDGDTARNQELLLEDLLAYRSMGIDTVLLLNANCYGEGSLSRTLSSTVKELVSDLVQETGGLNAVTTTSPFIASELKSEFPELELRASVNMKIATAIGMEYLEKQFDTFYLAKELNRDLDTLAELSAWAGAHGKKISILVNSGCLNHCSNQIFHDNLVAHEAEFDPADMASYRPVQCRNYLQDPAHWGRLLSHSNWLRPEELSRYESLFDTVKLATRMHFNPYMVIGAYASGTHRGNMLDLTEPSFSQQLFPAIVDNSRFPGDWHTYITDEGAAEAVLQMVMRQIM